MPKGKIVKLKKKPLSPYVGLLTPKAAAEGIEAAINNARALLEDAELLLEHGRWSRTAALAVLAIEEAGKPHVIRGILLARTDDERRDEWRAYRSHTKKNVTWILKELVAKGARNFDDLRQLFDPGSDHPEILDAVKQIALYSDAYGKCNWSAPKTVIDEKLARRLVEIARPMCGGPPEEHALTSTKELELRVAHMAPVWKGDTSKMKQALIVCCAEAERLGVLRGKHGASEFTAFVLGGHPSGSK